MSVKKNIAFIENQAQMDELATLVTSRDRVYFDMEVDNMYHYFNEVSLIQILVDDTCYIVDALSDIQIGPLISSLKKPELVIHGSDFDLRTLFQHYGFVPAKVFDTMIAARLIGLEEFGLGSLVQRFFNVTLDKQYQKANWSLRPLKPEMVEYAAGDTFYLPELYGILAGELIRKGRLAWHEESCDFLIAQTQVIKDADFERIWRIKGSSRLESRQLHVLKALWEWRDHTAREKNWPPFKVFNSEAMLALARSVPPQVKIAWDLGKAPLKTHASLKKSLRDALKKALQDPPEKWPPKRLPGNPRVKPKNPQLIESMKKIRDEIAGAEGLMPSLLINRESMVAVAETGLVNRTAMGEATVLMKWQKDLLFDSWLTLVD